MHRTNNLNSSSSKDDHNPVNSSSSEDDHSDVNSSSSDGDYNDENSSSSGDHNKMATIRTLGKGHYSQVDLVKDNGKLVAIKWAAVWNPKNEMDKQPIKHLEREIAALEVFHNNKQRKGYSNIVEYYGGNSSSEDIGNGKKYTAKIQLEYADGNLLEYLINKDPVSFNSTAHFNFTYKVMQDMSKGLCFIHRCGFFHGDLKPDNVLVFEIGNEFPNFKIADFGMSQDVLKAFPTCNRGSLMYMAPEVLSGKPNSCRADIYSLAVVSWETATGYCIYSDLGLTDDSSKAKLKQVIVTQGKRSAIPKDCLPKIAGLITWGFASNRPTAAQLEEETSTPLDKISDRVRSYLPF